MVKELVKIQSLSLPSVLHNPKVLCLIKKKIKSNLISEISIQLFPNYFPFSSKKNLDLILKIKNFHRQASFTHEANFFL